MSEICNTWLEFSWWAWWRGFWFPSAFANCVIMKNSPRFLVWWCVSLPTLCSRIHYISCHSAFSSDSVVFLGVHIFFFNASRAKFRKGLTLSSNSQEGPDFRSEKYCSEFASCLSQFVLYFNLIQHLLLSYLSWFTVQVKFQIQLCALLLRTKNEILR